MLYLKNTSSSGCFSPQSLTTVDSNSFISLKVRNQTREKERIRLYYMEIAETLERGELKKYTRMKLYMVKQTQIV